MPSDRLSFGAGLALGLAYLGAALYGLVFADTELHQGDVYRILYLHVPAAFAAFASSFVLFLASIQGLRRPMGDASLWGKATSEVGLLFTVITLATGSIWGKPTWGVWWTWDARLTTTLILALLYCGYLVFAAAMPGGPLRTKVSAVLGILIFADVPIIYKSVSWWRTLHQPHSLLRSDGPAMSPAIVTHLVVCMLITIALALWLIWQRSINLRLQSEINAASFSRIS